LTPWAVVGAIVLLGSRAGARAALAFVAGWFCAIAFIASIVAAGVGGLDAAEEGQTATGVLIVELVLGVLLIGLALRKWTRERSLPPATHEPRWLRKLDTMGPLVAFAFGTFMINVVFVVDAGRRIAAANLTGGDAALALAFYSVLSTASLLAVLIVYFSDRAHAEKRLADMRAWVTRNNAAVIVGMLAAVGAALTLKGAIGLVA
jgi:hypothetical protein